MKKSIWVTLMTTARWDNREDDRDILISVLTDEPTANDSQFPWDDWLLQWYDAAKVLEVKTWSSREEMLDYVKNYVHIARATFRK